ncbi:MAG: ACP S-malonyltransferase [Bordetella sp.]|nr:MAG: ACP S-malonyltransferase [Bordetella sp.]
MKIAFVFPGQGSQSIGMLDAWVDNEIINNFVARSSIVIGSDLGALISEGPIENLNLTVNTQPVMFTVGIAFFEAWRVSGGPMPNIMAGHSLGEYTALAAAGCLSLEDGVKLVKIRAQAIQEAIPIGIGSMSAILGLDNRIIFTICKDISDNEIVVEPVNFNSPKQTVIAGHKTAVEKACKAAKLAGAKRVLTLPVSAPFHSSLLEPASHILASALEKTLIQAPKIDVINNVDVKISDNPNVIRDALVRQIWNPVRWTETLKFMKTQGITHIVECGPGKILSSFTKQMNLNINTLSISDPDSLEIALSTIGNFYKG